MNNILVVFGATGQQGSSIVSYVSKEMPNKFKIRAVTRDPSKPEAEALKQKGIEVVKADLNDNESIKQAVKGAETVFAMSTISFDEKSKSEFEQGKTIADAAVEEKVPFLIWSTLVNAREISEGELQHVRHFDQKENVEKYIRSLPIKSSFFSPGCFMQNFQVALRPQPTGDGTYSIFNILKPNSEVPFIDTADSGKFLGVILANPEKYEGKVLSAAVDLYSFDTIAETISKVTGKTVIYTQISEDKFREFMPSLVADEMTEMFKLFDNYGYYGPQTKEKVAWTIQQVRGKLITLEGFFRENSLNLE